MKTFTSRWSKQTTLLILTLLGLVLMTFFNACKKSAEKTSEVLIEKSIGSDADVDIDDQKIVIETDEGTFTSDATVTTWPKEIPGEVPEFKFGKISNLSTQIMNEGKSWTFVFEEVPANAMEDYKKILKNKGYKVNSVSMPGGKGQVTGEKGKTIVAMMLGDNMASLNVSIEN